MKKLFILFLVGILFITTYAGVPATVNHIEIIGPVVRAPGTNFLNHIEIIGPVVRATGTDSLAHIEIIGPVTVIKA